MTHGIDETRVSAWLAASLPDHRAPFRFALISGGRSNLTYRVSDADDRVLALRRPPTGELLPSAHDMSREHRIITALARTDVPVPNPLGFCGDTDVNGAPFYVMDFVDGNILRTPELGREVFTEAQRRTASEQLVDVLVALHAVAPEQVGLGDLARRDAYIERQLRRWHGQFEQAAQHVGRDLPLAHELHEQLSRRIPPQHGAALVHGDYRLDNVVYDDDARIRAVLDWEICTIGDPLADVAQLLIFWGDLWPDHNPLGTALNSSPGFATGSELRDRYAARSGRELEHLDFYLAFVYWKLACMLEGVNARYATGRGGGDATPFGGTALRPEGLFEAAQAIIRGGLRGVA